MAVAGFKASVALTLLGILLGACIRSSTTLIPAHYHASLGAVTAAFMAGAYLIIERFAHDAGRLESLAKLWRPARRQIVLFGIGQSVFAIGFGIGGVYGLGRKAYAGEQHVRSAGELAGIGIMGIGGLLAVVAGLWFLTLVIRELRRGRRAKTPLPPLTPTHANP
jgi:heme/copper-type cytochrome/quinol oxidase subunit 1